VFNELPLLPLILDNVPPGLRQALAQEGVPARLRISTLPEGRFVLFDSQGSGAPFLAPGQVAIDVHSLRGEGEDPLELLLDRRARPHHWEFAGQKVVEEIALVDKRRLREQVLGRLRATIESVGGVWLRVAAYPFPFRTALNYRIDYDQYDPQTFAATLAAVAGNASCTSHFVNGAAYHRHARAMAQLRGLDVGSHGFWHHTYRTEEENLRNMARGIATLQAARIEPSGFVAPHGRFHEFLLAAMQRLGITHSSEFGLVYDELPFFPGDRHVLQIPIHPVCVEIFYEAARRMDESYAWREGADDAQAAPFDAALEYFAQVARQKYAAGDPLFFYGHPSCAPAGRPHVLQALLDAVGDSPAIWRTTLSEFGAWWRVRSGVRLSVSGSAEEYTVQADLLPGDYPIGIEFCRGAHVALMPLDRPQVRFAPEALAYEHRAREGSIRPVRIDGAHAFRERFKRWIDWERETPVEEIAPINWRNVAKRALRRLLRPAHAAVAAPHASAVRRHSSRLGN